MSVLLHYVVGNELNMVKEYTTFRLTTKTKERLERLADDLDLSMEKALDHALAIVETVTMKWDLDVKERTLKIWKKVIAREPLSKEELEDLQKIFVKGELK